MYDLVIIGGGLAGSIAALHAKSTGARVALANRSWGATALCTGALDIAYNPALSPAQQLPRSLAEHVMDIIAHRPRHPYGVLGLENTFAGLRAGYEVLSAALAEAGLPLPPLSLESENLGLPSSTGAVLPAATALPSHRGLDFVRPLTGRVGIVQLGGDTYFNARRVAVGLEHDATLGSGSRPTLEVVPVEFPASDTPLGTAMRLDDASELERLALALRERASGFQALVVPPVIGLDRHARALSRLREVLGVPVVEALAHAPSVPGVRLMRALEAQVRRAGIDAVGEMTTPVLEGRRIVAMRTRDDLEIQGGAFVLATGRFLAGGVRWGERCREALFDLPVVTELGLLEENEPHGVVRESPVESHPLMTAGVLVGPDLRPILEGRRAFQNLFAAGMVIGGFASRYVLCADGVAMATGILAAQHALATLRVKA